MQDTAIHRRLNGKSVPWCMRALLSLALVAAVLTGRVPAQEPTNSEYTVFELRHAEAGDVESTLQEVLDGLPGGAEVVVDQRANRILVRGSAAARRMAEKIVHSLDRPPPVPANAPRRSKQETPANSKAAKGTAFKGMGRSGQGESGNPPGDRILKSYAVPEDRLKKSLARLKQAYPAESGARIAADWRSSQILVLAEPSVQERIGRWLSGAPARKTTPKERSETRVRAAVPAPRSSVLPPGRSEGAARSKPVTVELRFTQWREIEENLVRLWGDRLVTGKRSSQRASYLLGLEENGQVQIEADLRARLVRIWGPVPLNDRCARVIRALDEARAVKGRRSEVVPVVHAPAAKIQRLAAALQSAPGDRRRAGGRGPRIARVFQPGQDENGEGAPAEEGVGLEGEDEGFADEDEGVSEDDMPQDGEATLEGEQELDEDLPEGQGPDEMDEANEQLEGEQPPADEEGAGGLVGPVQIEYIEGLDVLVVIGNDRDVEKVMKIIEDIENLSQETVPDVVVHPLKHVGSEALATIVTQLYDQVLSPRQGRVSITPLAKPNALLLIGRKDSVTTVVDLVKQLDQPVGPAGQFEVYRLRHASAAATRATITEFFANRTGLGTRVLVTNDFRTNALIVQASPRDLAEVGRLIQRLDTPTSAAVNELRVIKLERSLAEELAPILQEAINTQTTQRGGQGQQQQPGGGQAGALQAFFQGGGQGGPGGQGGGGQGAQQSQQLLARSTMLRFLTVDAEGQRKLNSGILTDVRISADPRANSLLVSGPSDSMDLIEALIRELDQAPAAVSQIKVFTIVNGDASSLVEMLEGLFGQQGAGGQDGLVVSDSADGGGLVGLQFSVDVRTNSIIAAGSAGDLNVVEAVLLRLDASDVRQRESIVYKLRNSYAVEVANAINEFLRSEQQVGQNAPGLISPFEQIEREVIVVPEEVSNSLIVSATPRYFEEIRKIVDQLDARNPMVMIQVLIAEIKLNNTDEFGVELGLQDSVLFDRSLLGDLITTNTSTTFGNPPTTTQTQTVQSATLTPGFNFNNLPLGNSGSDRSFASREHTAGQALTNFSVGRLNNELGYGGLIMSASSESINILIRALKECRRLDVLSRPQVMTLDNQPAFIQVGARVPRVRGVETNQTGQTSNVVDENVGLILAVTPRVAPDGLIVMEIDAEKSALGPEEEGVPISISATGDVVRQPVINTTTAQTTISATTGQTVVLGGLITKTRSSIQRRVPLLADVPVLGHLFRYDSISSERTELLIILTPHVVRTEEDAQLVKQTEAARMSWCLADVRRIHGDIGPLGRFDEFSELDTRVIYPDRDPGGVELVPVPENPVPENPTPAGPELLPPGAESPGQPRTPADVEPVPPAGARLSPGRVTPARYVGETGGRAGSRGPGIGDRGQVTGNRAGTTNPRPGSRPVGAPSPVLRQGMPSAPMSQKPPVRRQSAAQEPAARLKRPLGADPFNRAR